MSHLRAFLLICFCVGFGAQVASGLTQNTNWLWIGMWAPALGLLGAGREGLDVFRGLKVVGLKYLPVALLLGWLPHLLAQVLLYGAGLGDGVVDIDALPRLAGSLVVSTLATTVLLALGEELGWRGYLQNELQQNFGFVKGTFVLGVVWSAWHIPANLAGLNGTENVWLVTFVTFPIGAIAMSYALGWIRNASGSVWPCALLHGANNAVSDVKLVEAQSAAVGDALDLAAYIVAGLLCLWLGIRQRNCGLRK